MSKCKKANIGVDAVAIGISIIGIGIAYLIRSHLSEMTSAEALKELSKFIIPSITATNLDGPKRPCSPALPS